MTYKEATEIYKGLTDEQRLAAAAVVFQAIHNHVCEGGGTFRYLIYDRLGFNTSAYAILHQCGGMDVSNLCNTRAGDDL